MTHEIKMFLNTSKWKLKTFQLKCVNDRAATRLGKTKKITQVKKNGCI